MIFGHTHRAGPLPADDAGEWRLAGGAQLLNRGCWVFESMYLDRDGAARTGPAAPSSSTTAARRASCACSTASSAGALRPRAPAPA